MHFISCMPLIEQANIALAAWDSRFSRSQAWRPHHSDLSAGRQGEAWRHTAALAAASAARETTMAQAVDAMHAVLIEQGSWQHAC